jgi:hypothetical protein
MTIGAEGSSALENEIIKSAMMEEHAMKCPNCSKELTRVWRVEETAYTYSVDEKGEYVEIRGAEPVNILTDAKCCECNAVVEPLVTL